jgi:hypothetical protein
MDFVENLKAALGDSAVETGDDVPPRNRADASGADPVAPLALVLPRSTEAVSAALALCYEAGQLYEAMWKEIYAIATSVQGLAAPPPASEDVYLLIEAPDPRGTGRS